MDTAATSHRRVNAAGVPPAAFTAVSMSEQVPVRCDDTNTRLTRRLEELEEENRRLRETIADQSIQIQMLEYLVGQPC